MARLIGRYDLNMDGKGRLVLPSVHRSRYEDGAILTLKSNHVGVYEPEKWDAFVEELEVRRRDGQISRDEFNIVTMSAADLTMDTAGRILIPAWMREEMGLVREVLVTGNQDYLGIYAPDQAATISPARARAASRRTEELGL